MTETAPQSQRPSQLRKRALGLIEQVPLPLAQLARRALDGKSAVERHNCAYYLGEATLKLAAAARIRLYLERALEPEGKVARRLVCLKLPSLGQWCELLRSTNDELGVVPDADRIPLARQTKALLRRPVVWDAVVRLGDAVVEAQVLNRDVARRGVSGGVMGFFELLTAYRNEVIGHGAQRPDAYCDLFANLLLDAMGDVLSSESVFDGLVLGRAVADAGEPDRFVWQNLQGLEPRLSSEQAGEVDPTQLFLRDPQAGDGDVLISVHPLVVVREDDLGREQVGFLNRTLLRTRTIAHGLVEEVRRVDYLDYATGDTFSGFDTREGMRELLQHSRQAEQEDGAVVAGPVGRGVVLGDFELKAPIGRGAAGVVFAARQRSMNRTVAIKVLEPSVVATDLQVRRFHREIAALARCDHPNVVKVLTAGVHQSRHFYAMEFVDGADLARIGRVLASWRRDEVVLTSGHLDAAVLLAQRIQARTGERAGPDAGSFDAAPPPDADGVSIEIRIAELCADAADGLHHLHERGTVHRDVKPGNLMLTADGTRMVVMDLGSAHLVDETVTLTRSGMGLAGTLRYMAPEQLERRRDAVDGRVDVYALGATLYELLAGRRLFDGDNEARIVRQVLGERPVPLRSVAGTVPRALEAVVERATRKRPEDRYPTARALAEDLRAFAASRPTQAKPAGPTRRLASFALRHRAAVIVGGALAASAAAGGWTGWQWLSPHRTAYYRCTQKLGTWVGVEEVEEVAGRERSCVVTERSGRVQRVTFVNGLGAPVENEHGDAVIDFVYAEGGVLLERIHRGRDGRVRQKHRLAWDGSTLHTTVVDRNNFRVSLDGSEASMVRTVFDDRGYPERRAYLSDRGSPRRNAERVFGHALQADARGLVLRATAVDADGAPMRDREGVTSRVWVYDARGLVVERRHLDGSDSLWPDRDGAAVLRWTLDGQGNRSSEQRLDATSKPVIGPDGCAGWRASHDAAGSIHAWTCIGTEGKPDWHREGFVTRRAEHDTRGNVRREAYFGSEGEPTRHRDGYAAWEASYDERGQRVEQRFFDEAGRPSNHRDGYALWRAKHDDAGHLVRVGYFDTGGNPTLHRDGVASWRSDYDDRGNLLASSYFGRAGEPVLTRYGYARRGWRHDERGNIVELSYYGLGGALRASVDGYARLRARYDERGRRVEQRYFDVAGRPTTDAKEGAFGVRFEYDAQGRVKRRVMLGAAGEPGVTAAGLAVEQVDHDSFGRPERRRFLGEQGAVLGETRADWSEAERAARRMGAARAARPNLFPGGSGVVVAGVFRDETSGTMVRPGDVLVSLAGSPVFDERDVWLEERRTNREALQAVVVRDGVEVRVGVTPTDISRMLFLSGSGDR